MPIQPLDVVCALVFHGDHVLATRRDPSRSFPLMWEFPGGKTEGGEAPEESLHRELEEELSLRIRIISQLDPVPFRKESFVLNLIPFLCQPDQDQAPVPHEHVELRWVTPLEAGLLEWAPADVPLVRELSACRALLWD